jgi:copper chaperone CopZ
MRQPRDVAAIVVMVVGVTALAAFGPWLFHELSTLPRARSLAARAGQRVVTLEVGGMTCGGCAQTVESKLVQLPGVSTVAVRFAQRRAYVVCDTSVTDTTLTAAVHRAGPGFLAVVATP